MGSVQNTDLIYGQIIGYLLVPTNTFTHIRLVGDSEDPGSVIFCRYCFTYIFSITE